MVFKTQRRTEGKIQQVFDESKQIYGAGKITAVLKERGCITSEKTVRFLMQEMGLISIRQISKSLYEKELRKCNNRLNQQFNPSAPNQVWVVMLHTIVSTIKTTISVPLWTYTQGQSLHIKFLLRTALN